MLSTENPPPDPPPPTSCPPSDLITRLRIGDDDDDDDHHHRASDQVDLLKATNPEKLPKFSIRDYVFNNRSKDIAANWPFSQKNLQLCLNNDVKDLLPRFESLDLVRNRLRKKNEPETRLVVGGDTDTLISDVDGDPSKKNGDHVNEPEGDHIDLVPTDCSKPRGNKNPSTSHRGSKKCRFPGKLSSNNNATVASSNEDTVSETMASNVCPVCKTFSSPSNTTLNAHIDQCLSVEARDKRKGTDNNAAPKVTKQQRVNPRKMRLMADVYATAPMSTLEELDIRNGSSWNDDARVEEKRERAVLPINVEETGDEGAVYIDENGTKVRILSKFNDASKSQVGLETRPLKNSKGGKKKKQIAHKNIKKHLKLAPQSKKIGSSKTNAGGSKVCGGGIERQLRVAEENVENSKAQQQDQIKPVELGDMRKRVRSKRTGLSKKSKGKRILQLSSDGEKLESDHTPHVERSFIPETSDSSDFPPSSPEKIKKIHNSSNELNGISSFGNLNTKFRTKQMRKEDSPLDLPRKNLPPSSNKSRMEIDHSSTRKKFLSVKQPSMHIKKSSVPKKHNDDQSRRDRVRKIRTKGGSKSGIAPREEETRALESSYNRNDIESAEKGVYTTVGSDIMNKQSESEFPKLSIPSYTRAKTLRSSFYDDDDDDEDEEMFMGNDDDISHNTRIGVDQITIPGPPGSFLPSPRGGGGGGGGMSSGNNQGSSSLTSNQILQSSEGIHDMVVDKDSSDSPISNTSTVSNSAMGLSLGPNVTSAGAQKINLDESEKGFLAFKPDDDQPCYCFRKEGLSLNYQESELRRRRDNMNCDLNRIIPGMNSNPEEFQCSSPPKKASNPVLRLMGKDLMVVNKEPQPEVPPRGGVSYGDLNFHNQMVDQRPFTFGPNRNNVVGRGYDVNMAKTFPSTTPQTLGGVFPSFESTNMWTTTYDMEKTRATPSANPDKEIIVIDDTDTDDDGARQVNPFYNEPPMTQNASFGTPNSSSPLKWNCSSKPSSSTGHVRSSLYYSPSFT